MKLVLDTNVIVSLVLRNTPPILTLMDACRQGEATLVLSRSLIQELGRVLHKPGLQRTHRYTDLQISRFLHQLTTFALIVPGDSPVEGVSDPKDMIVLATALAGRADLIVTGDKKHLLSLQSFSGIPIVTPAEAVKRLARERQKRVVKSARL